MSNMGYCRFQYTLADLQDCYEWLADSDQSKLSESERTAFDRLVKLCASIAADYDDA